MIYRVPIASFICTLDYFANSSQQSSLVAGPSRRPKLGTCERTTLREVQDIYQGLVPWAVKGSKGPPLIKSRMCLHAYLAGPLPITVFWTSRTLFAIGLMFEFLSNHESRMIQLWSPRHGFDLFRSYPRIGGAEEPFANRPHDTEMPIGTRLMARAISRHIIDIDKHKAALPTQSTNLRAPRQILLPLLRQNFVLKQLNC